MISREGRDSTGVVNNGPSGLNSALPQGERAVSIAARSIWCLTAAVAGLSLIPILRNSFVAVYHYCGHDNCVSGQLTAVAARGLESAGLPPTAYAVYDDVLLVGMVTTFCAVAAAIVWRRSSDPMALLTAFTLTLFGGATLTNGARLLGPASVWFEPFTVLAMLGSLGIGLFAYLFPSGWRLGPGAPGRLIVPILVAAWAVVQFSTYIVGSGYLDFSDPSNPFGPPEWVFFLLSMIAVQIYRYRNQADPVQKQQTKWVVLGITASLLCFISLLAIAGFYPDAGSNTVLFLAVQTVFRLVLLPVPISIAFAVLRHRLWDVDILINRTIVYAGLTISLAAFYVGGVIVFQSLFRA
ncbi:MAG TPA: hypothetical protein VFA78_08005, partial [Chloroflexota bacterium]|nr:hypothetical protein [Chloroflexota bacterium]